LVFFSVPAALHLFDTSATQHCELDEPIVVVGVAPGWNPREQQPFGGFNACCVVT
jgi:hypothetical protein